MKEVWNLIQFLTWRHKWSLFKKLLLLKIINSYNHYLTVGNNNKKRTTIQCFHFYGLTKTTICYNCFKTFKSETSDSFLLTKDCYDEIFPDLSRYADIDAVILPVISDQSYSIKKKSKKITVCCFLHLKRFRSILKLHSNWFNTTKLVLKCSK